MKNSNLIKNVMMAVMMMVIILDNYRPIVDAGEKKTYEERLSALEKENAALRKSMNTRFVSGNYRMSEMEADIREVEGRLATGKAWMTELQTSYVALLDRIRKYHPDKKKGH